MKQLEQGKVVKILSDSAQVEVSPNSKCRQCCACEISGSGKIIIEALNSAGAKLGDRAEVEISAAAKDLFPFLFLAVPVLLFFCGIFIGNKISEEAAVVLGFLFLIAGFVVVQIISRLKIIKKNFGNKIVKVILD